MRALLVESFPERRARIAARVPGVERQGPELSVSVESNFSLGLRGARYLGQIG